MLAIGLAIVPGLEHALGAISKRCYDMVGQKAFCVMKNKIPQTSGHGCDSEIPRFPRVFAKLQVLPTKVKRLQPVKIIAFGEMNCITAQQR